MSEGIFAAVCMVVHRADTMFLGGMCIYTKMINDEYLKKKISVCDNNIGELKCASDSGTVDDGLQLASYRGVCAS